MLASQPPSRTFHRILPMNPNPSWPVHFFVQPAGITLERALSLDPDTDWTDLRRAREVWIIQTWKRLLRAGYPVTMSNRVPSGGIIVYHKEDQRSLLGQLPADARPVLVGVRADFRSCDAADVEVLQNGYYADGERTFFVPHWPQPGLLQRDPARGDRIERLSYKGYVGNLAEEFRAPGFGRFLAGEGIVFEDDAILDDASDHPILTRFHDYREVDLVLAVRPGPTTHKPASKLVNAWHAGTPALLSPDYPFVELRRSDLDYLSVRDVPEAQAAIRRLKSEPGLFRAMVEHGRVRARDFTFETVTARWAELLFETVPRLAAARPRDYWLPARRSARIWRRKLVRAIGFGDRR